MSKADISDVIVYANTSIRSAVETINKNGVRGVFVCDEDKELLGIVMDSDIRRAALSNLDSKASVKTILKPSPFVINSEASIEKRKELFLMSEKLLAPIVDNKKCVVDYIYLPDILDKTFNKECIDNDLQEDAGILPPEKVLVIGGAGYIGSMLTKKLLRRGYRVKVLDLLLYGKDGLQKTKNENLEFIKGDCRDEQIIKKVLEGVDAVIHLGEIVGDPACEINEMFTIETNYTATQTIVEQCMKFGTRRFIFASSCSVYGSNDIEVNEETELNPISLYARCKRESEKAVLSLTFDYTCPTILRLATVHGRSYRQRFDLVVNLLTIKALAEGKIQIFGGDQWRPLISVEDVCRGIIAVLNAESWKVKNQTFNLGDSRENYQLTQISDIIRYYIPEVKVENLKDKTDNRNYRVNFEKIKKRLGFVVENNVSDTVKEIISAYRNENLFQDYKNHHYYNVLALKEDECEQ